MSRVVVVSGGCGVGKTATLQVMRGALDGLAHEVATLETDTFYMFIDPTWSIPWPEAGRYGQIARGLLRSTVLGLVESGFDWIAIGSNGLCEEWDVRAFVAPLLEDRRVRVHHVTLDPGVRVVQERVAARFARHRYAVDEKKTPEWLESQMLWFRERYGPWTHVLDNGELTPAETAAAIFEAVLGGAGALDERS